MELSADLRKGNESKESVFEIGSENTWVHSLYESLKTLKYPVDSTAFRKRCTSSDGYTYK